MTGGILFATYGIYGYYMGKIRLMSTRWGPPPLLVGDRVSWVALTYIFWGIGWILIGLFVASDKFRNTTEHRFHALRADSKTAESFGEMRGVIERRRKEALLKEILLSPGLLGIFIFLALSWILAIIVGVIGTR